MRAFDDIPRKAFGEIRGPFLFIMYSMYRTQNTRLKCKILLDYYIYSIYFTRTLERSAYEIVPDRASFVATSR